MGKDFRRGPVDSKTVKNKSHRSGEDEIFYKRPKLYKRKPIYINQVLDQENDPINNYRNLFSVDVNYDFQ